MNYLTLIIIAVVSFAFGRKSVKAKIFAPKSADELKDMRVGAKEVLSERTEKRKERILGFLESNEKITNNDVEKLCEVSHATAERYLNQLEKDGKLTQHGKIGTDVFYTLK